MIIYGVALLATCTLVGDCLGEVLGRLLGINADIGGVGFGMIALIAGRALLRQRGWLGPGVIAGVEFWSAMYLPIIVAMAATQDVVAAIRSGPVVILASALAFALCLVATALLCRSSGGRGRAATDDAGASARETALVLDGLAS